LFISDKTPKFFAIENIDNALNPKLACDLMKVLAQLAEKYGKQVIFTTHNAAILDGLNLNDPEQRLFVASRNAVGHTKMLRIEKKPPTTNRQSVKLSEQFLRGYIGGLNF
jgi:predicted ATPase